MIDSDKYAAAVFFVAARQNRTALTQLLQRAGATEIETKPPTPEDASGLAICTWAGMTCRAYAFERAQHQVLHIFFFRSSLLDRLGPEPDDPDAVPVEKDGARDLALAFRDACLSLAPEVAFIAVRRGQGDPDWLLTHEAAVLAQDADALIAERFGLLYLNGAICRYATPALIETERDQLTVDDGCLLFAGLGWHRWFGGGRSAGRGKQR